MEQEVVNIILIGDHGFAFSPALTSHLCPVLVKYIILLLEKSGRKQRSWPYADFFHNYVWFLQLVVRKELVMSDLWVDDDQLVCCNWCGFHGLLMLIQRVISNPVWRQKEWCSVSLEQSPRHIESVTVLLRCNASPEGVHVWTLGYLEYILFNEKIINK